MSPATQFSVAEAEAPRGRGLVVVATERDADAAWTTLPHAATDWTVLALFAARERNVAGGAGAQARLLSGGLENKGWQSRYREIGTAIRGGLRRAEEIAGPFDQFATHGLADCDAHPAIWHLANVVAAECGERPLKELMLRDRPPEPGDDCDHTELLRQPMNGQIVQRPNGDFPGVLVSPFWTIPWSRRKATREAIMRHGRTERWYVAMADTTYCNLPPSYVLPFIGARFSVDPAERRYFRARFPDLDLLEFCQSQLTPESVYAPMPGIAKEFDLVYSARICEVKRHWLLLDALVQLKREGRALKTLLLYYPKDNEDTRSTTQAVRERIAAEGLDVTLHTTGQRGNAEREVAEALNRCRAGVFMSAEEGPAFAIPEYLLCDLPVVADAGLRGGGLHFLNDRNSRLFDDPANLPRALLEVLDERAAFSPRRSALDQAIGEQAGNDRFAACLAATGIALSDDAQPLRRHLDQIELEELCR